MVQQRLLLAVVEMQQLPVQVQQRLLVHVLPRLQLEVQQHLQRAAVHLPLQPEAVVILEEVALVAVRQVVQVEVAIPEAVIQAVVVVVDTREEVAVVQVEVTPAVEVAPVVADVQAEVPVDKFLQMNS